MNTKIENVINEVGCVIRNGINKLMYDFTFQHLTNELEKCKSEMEYYKNELEKIKKEFSNNKENIVLEIHDDISNKSGATKSTIDNFFCLNHDSKNIVVSKNEPDVKEDDESEEEDDAGIEEDVASVEEETVAGLEEEDGEEEEEEDEEEEEAAESLEEEAVESLEEEEQAEEDAEDEEVFEIEIDDVTYYTENEENGNIYSVDENGDPGNKIGYLKDGEPFFY